jgi:hypothetical protein
MSSGRNNKSRAESRKERASGGAARTVYQALAAPWKSGIDTALILEAIAKPVFIVILNKVKDLKILKMRDSSRRSE